MEVGTRFYAAAMLAGILLLPGCFGSSKKDESSLKVINVLDKELYDDAHIPGSIQIPVMEVKKRAESWPKTTEVVIYCSNYACTASTMVARQLGKMGFEKVWDYEAGMAGWKQAGYPVEGPATQAYLDAPNEKLSDAKHDGINGISTEDLKALLDKAQ